VRYRGTGNGFDSWSRITALGNVRDSLDARNILAEGERTDSPEGNVLKISFEQQISLTAVKFEL